MSHLVKPPLGTLPIIGHPLAQGLVGCWLMNEGSGDTVYDLSGNGNHGTLTGDTHWVPGKYGSCLDFDGAGDYVDLPTGLLSGAAQASVSVWAKKTAASDQTTRHIVSINYTNQAERISLEWDDNYDFVYWQVAATGGTGFAYTGNDNAVDVWYHFVGIYDGTNVLLYRNGILQPNTGTTSGPLETGSYYAAIGAWTSWGTRLEFHEGPIDNVMIFDRALGAGEIQQLYCDPFCMFNRRFIELWTGATSGGITPTEQNAIFFGCNF